MINMLLCFLWLFTFVNAHSSDRPKVHKVQQPSIVVFRQPPNATLTRRYGLNLQSVGNLHYAQAWLSRIALCKLRQSHLVERVQAELPARLDAATSSSQIQENPPSWGLDRIDQRHLPLNQQFRYPSKAGAGVTVYILDTGIDVNHSDLEGRAQWGTAIGRTATDPPVDDVGHGTAVAGIIGGARYGVAKKVTLVSVKVYRKQRDQTTSDVMAGLNWVLKHHQGKPGQKSILNMSSGTELDSTLNQAVEQLVDAGIVVVTSAGNDGTAEASFDGCQHSPSSSSKVISVGSVDRNDTVSSTSNIGRCITLFAPGVDVSSISSLDPQATITQSGTSFAAPHVAGVAALLLAQDGTQSPADIKARLVQIATPSVVKGLKSGDGSPNLLLYSDPKDSETQQKGSSASSSDRTIDPAVRLAFLIIAGFATLLSTITTGCSSFV